MRNKKVIVSSLIVLLSLMLSLVFPTGVLADDNPPPATETVEVVTPPEEVPNEETVDTVVSKSPATEERVLNDETMTTDETVSDVPTDVVTQEAVVDTGSAANDASLLSQMPEGTDVVVLNENGDQVSLASQEAVDIVQIVDPMWCPTGTLPGDGTCRNFLSVALLQNDINTNTGNYAQNGIIYFTSTAGTATTSFSLTTGSIGTTDFNTIKSYNLTLQGGWNGSSGASATFTGQTTFEDHSSVTIGSSSSPWGGNITLNNFTFNGVSTTNAVTIFTAGNMTLDNVTAELTTNNNHGARLNNTSGSGSSVTVTNSIFNQNTNAGLFVQSNGVITLVNVKANQNGVFGADLRNDINGSTQDVFVVNSAFSNNTRDGLRVESIGDITLINVTAQNNVNDGVDLSANNSANVIICGGTFSGNDVGGGRADYDVRAAGTTLIRTSDIAINNWSPTTGWTSIANGAGLCNYQDINADDDNDGVLDAVDNCSSIANSNQTDTDNDGTGDVCDATPNGDDDNDGVDNLTDNCSSIANSNQTDTDNDGIGDACDSTPNGDDDNDGVDNLTDNCLSIANSNQMDTDNDGIGDACDSTPNGDNDNDGVDNLADNCLSVANSAQTDTDNDGIGDACDSTPNGDDDNDGVDNLADNCLSVVNPAQMDMDNDGIGDACDTTPNGDYDNDGVDNLADNCLSFANPAQTDTDNDGIGDVCDATPNGQIDTSGTTTDDIPSFIPVTGQGAALSCTEPSTTLTMAGFEVTFTNLCGYSVVLANAPEGSLFGVLPDGKKYVSGIDVALLQDGNVVSQFPADTTTLSFDIPFGMTGETLVILYWDPNANGGAGAWVEKSGTVVDGKVTLAIDMPGTYVLADISTITSMKDNSHVVTTLNGLYSVVMNFFNQFALQ